MHLERPEANPMNSMMTETSTHSRQPAPSQADLSSAPTRQNRLVLFKAIRVNADAHRISLALTASEYLEAWIHIPGAAPGSLTVAASQHNGYRLSHYSAHRAPLTLTGSFVFCHLRKMRLLWRKTADAYCTDSIVDFRLRGNFGSSFVELRHTALASADEYAWHEALWGRSLQKLALLFGS
jgi:hypothetical protein